MNDNAIEWQTSFELGVEDIDFQHHYFVDLINRLSQALRYTDDIAYRSALLHELNAYVKFHFISEENMMTYAGYPGIDAHRRLHSDLINELNNRELELEIGDSEHDAHRIIDFLVDWFMHHSVREDKLFADYLHATMRD